MDCFQLSAVIDRRLSICWHWSWYVPWMLELHGYRKSTASWRCSSIPPRSWTPCRSTPTVPLRSGSGLPALLHDVRHLAEIPVCLCNPSILSTAGTPDPRAGLYSKNCVCFERWRLNKQINCCRCCGGGGFFLTCRHQIRVSSQYSGEENSPAGIPTPNLSITSLVL